MYLSKFKSIWYKWIQRICIPTEGGLPSNWPMQGRNIFPCDAYVQPQEIQDQKKQVLASAYKGNKFICLGFAKYLLHLLLLAFPASIPTSIKDENEQKFIFEASIVCRSSSICNPNQLMMLPLELELETSFRCFRNCSRLVKKQTVTQKIIPESLSASPFWHIIYFYSAIIDHLSFSHKWWLMLNLKSKHSNSAVNKITWS